jgi:hypothetical protein
VQRKLRKSFEPHKKNTGERATPFVLLVTGSTRQAPPHDDLRPDELFLRAATSAPSYPADRQPVARDRGGTTASPRHTTSPPPTNLPKTRTLTST